MKNDKNLSTKNNVDNLLITHLDKTTVNTVVGVYFHNQIKTDYGIIEPVYPFRMRIPEFENKNCVLNIQWKESIKGWSIIQSLEI